MWSSASPLSADVGAVAGAGAAQLLLQGGVIPRGRKLAMAACAGQASPPAALPPARLPSPRGCALCSMPTGEQWNPTGAQTQCASRGSGHLPDSPPRSDLSLTVPAPQERNERLFYHVISHNIEELLYLFTHPILGEYCQAFSLMFRRWRGHTPSGGVEWHGHTLRGGLGVRGSPTVRALYHAAWGPARRPPAPSPQHALP